MRLERRNPLKAIIGKTEMRDMENRMKAGKCQCKKKKLKVRDRKKERKEKGKASSSLLLPWMTALTLHNPG